MSADRFNSVCRTIWGDEWHPPAAEALGVSKRTVRYWSEGTFAPSDGWDHVFTSLKAIARKRVTELSAQAQRLKDFYR